MTGAEAVDSVIRLLNLKGVADDYEVATKKGLFKGLVEPIKAESKITNAEYITMIINALGYGDIMATEGDWPVNYTKKARELNLFEGVEGAVANNILTKETAINVLYNALNTKVWERIESNENGISFGQTKTVIEKYF